MKQKPFISETAPLDGGGLVYEGFVKIFVLGHNEPEQF